MRSHVWRPLLVVVGIVILILLVRVFVVPRDFGIHDQGYMYGFHRLGDEKDQKDRKVNYKFTNEYCKDCHEANYTGLMGSPHAIIPCEDCHGPAIDHPDNPPKLVIDKRRELCLRCHSYLPYPTSGRSKIRGIDPGTHNPGNECVMCHNPHHPNLEGM